MFSIALALGLASLLPAHATPPEQPKAPGIESSGYAWEAQSSEEALLLKIQGDIARGRITYQGCQGCHKPDASGLSDGTYPQLAGQHTTVLIKQMVDVRKAAATTRKCFPLPASM